MMKRDIRFLWVLLFSLVAAAILTAPAGAQVEASKEACLGCHGPFDKLVGMKPGYRAPSGETINPHRYVPHDAKEAKAIPECTNCHEPHQVPPTSAGLAALPKPGVEWCYTACHHKYNFTPCKECHK
jgi:hypothetical protein